MALTSIVSCLHTTGFQHGLHVNTSIPVALLIEPENLTMSMGCGKLMQPGVQSSSTSEMKCFGNNNTGVKAILLSVCSH